MTMPLSGVRVVDWTIWQQGPVATAMLADLGAEVIKLEAREGGDPGRGLVAISGTDVTKRADFYFEANNRGKLSVALDLRKPEAVDVVHRLVECSDVFVQNFRKGVAERLGLGFEALQARNPRLVYASANGYGPEGPDAGEPAYDQLGLARSGIMYAVGEPDMDPQNVGGGIADQMGAVMLSYGVLAGLLARERTGRGQQVHASQLGSMAWLQGLSMSSRLINGRAFPRVSRRRAFNPLWNHYRCADGRWLALGMLQSDRYWGDFCKAIGRPELATDPRFADMRHRAANAEACVAEFDAVFAAHSREHWMGVLHRGGDFIYTIVNSLDELADDPQMLANDYITEIDHPSFGPTRYLGFPVQLSDTPGAVRAAAPELGQHTEIVLTEMLGYDWDEITALRACGAI